MNLAGQIQALSNSPELNAELKQYKQELDAGQFTQEEYPIEMTKAYQQINTIHDRAFKLGHLAWIHKNRQFTKMGAHQNQVENMILYGNMKGAAESAKVLKKRKEEAAELIKMNK